MSLGNYPIITLADARERRDRARKLLANGVDPMAKRKEEKAVKRAQTEGSVQNIAFLWLEHWQEGKSPRHVEYTRRRMEMDILPLLGASPVAEIEAPELVAMTKATEQRGARDIANRALETAGRCETLGHSTRAYEDAHRAYLSAFATGLTSDRLRRVSARARTKA